MALQEILILMWAVWFNTRIHPAYGQVDCGPLHDPLNGQVNTSLGTTEGSVATYSCYSGYVISGSEKTTCNSKGMWSDSPPTCNSVDCGPLSNPINGLVNISSETTANYSCDNGYILIGPQTRHCGSNGQWSSPVPSCKNITVTVELSPTADNLKLGQNYNLICTVRGASSLYYTITWLYTNSSNNRLLPVSLLTFDPLVLTDTGGYSCVVNVYPNFYRSTSHHTIITSDVFELGLTSVFIQIRLSGVLSCEEYTLRDPHQKADGITDNIVQAIEDQCGCGFNTSYITNSFLKCFSESSPKHVTYRAQLHAPANHTLVELVAILSEWVEETQGLVIERVNLNINNTCPLVIADIDSPECPEQLVYQPTYPTSTQTALDPSGIITAAVPASTGVLILIAVIAMVILVVTCKRKSTTSKKVKTESIALRDKQLTEGVTNPTIEATEANHHDYQDSQEVSHVTEQYSEVGWLQPQDNNYNISDCPAYKTAREGTG